MSLSTAAQLQILQYYFQGALPPPLGLVYVGLHNAAPGAGGNQSTGETFYSGYARLPVAPSSGTFLVSSGPPARAQNLQPLAFPACSGTLGDTLNFWSLGTMPSGPSPLITYGPLGNGLVCGFTGWAGTPSTLFVPALPFGTLVNSTVVLQALGPGVLLPRGFVDGQLYYVGTVNIVTGMITLSTTLNNGSPVAASAPGSGYLYPVTPLNVAQGNVPTFPPNSLLTFQG